MKTEFGKLYGGCANEKIGQVCATVLWFMLFVLSAGVGEATAQGQEQQKAYRVDEFKSSEVEAINVQTFGGPIEVHGTDNATTILEMYVKKGDNYLDENEESLSDYDIQIKLDRGKLVAKADRKGFMGEWGSNIAIGFKIYGPEKANLDLKTRGGPIVTKSIEGRHKLQTSGGPLTLTDMKGTLEASTSGGPITLNSCQGDLSAQTSGGPIYANESSGSITLRTSGGPIKLRDVRGQILAKTSGGSIEADISELRESLNLQTSGGNITVKLPEDAGYNLQAEGGTITSELGQFSGTTRSDKVEGKVNGGGPMVKLITSAGQVRINQ